MMHTLTIIDNATGQTYTRDKVAFAAGTFADVYHLRALADQTTDQMIVKEEKVPLMFVKQVLDRLEMTRFVDSIYIASGWTVSTCMITSTLLRISTVMPYYPTTLHAWIRANVRANTPWTCSQAAALATHMLRGLDYLHTTVGIVHADITTSNMLLDSHNNLVITDLGSSVSIASKTGTCNSETAVAYRPPEGLGGGMLTAAYDMWSAGCIFAELMVAHPLLFRIPSCADWPEPVAALCKIMLLLGPPDATPGAQIYRVLLSAGAWIPLPLPEDKKLHRLIVGLVSRLLRYDAATRATASTCLTQLTSR